MKTNPTPRVQQAKRFLLNVAPPLQQGGKRFAYSTLLTGGFGGNLDYED